MELSHPLSPMAKVRGASPYTTGLVFKEQVLLDRGNQSPSECVPSGSSGPVPMGVSVPFPILPLRVGKAPPLRHCPAGPCVHTEPGVCRGQMDPRLDKCPQAGTWLCSTVASCGRFAESHLNGLRPPGHAWRSWPPALLTLLSVSFANSPPPSAPAGLRSPPGVPVPLLPCSDSQLPGAVRFIQPPAQRRLCLPETLLPGPPFA